MRVVPTIDPKLPVKTGSLVMQIAEPDEDYFVILISGKLSPAQQARRFEHELQHILFDDLYRGGSADQIEKEAHSRPQLALEEYFDIDIVGEEWQR